MCRWQASSVPKELKVDRDTANARVGTWLREVANARVHATTGEVPLVRLEHERERLQPMPTPWPGMILHARTEARRRYRSATSIRCGCTKS